MANKFMTKEQLRYAQNRLSEIQRKERDAIVDQCWIKIESQRITFGELAAAIKSGGVKPRTQSSGGGYTGRGQLSREVTRHTLITDVFNLKIPDVYRKRDNAKFDKLSKAHKEKWDAIWDKIMLSTAEDVLTIIKDLEK